MRKQAWMKSRISSAHSQISTLSQIFDKSEIKLITSLMNTAYKYTQCTTESPTHEDIYQTVEEELQYGHLGPRKAQPKSARKSPRCENLYTTPEVNDSLSVVDKDDNVIKELRSVCRQLRVALYNGGLLQAVAPFLQIGIDTENVKVCELIISIKLQHIRR